MRTSSAAIKSLCSRSPSCVITVYSGIAVGSFH
jgi:hypothetical protein